MLRFLLEKTTKNVTGLSVAQYPEVTELREALSVGPADHADVVRGCLRVAASSPSRRQDPDRLELIARAQRELVALDSRTRGGRRRGGPDLAPPDPGGQGADGGGRAGPDQSCARRQGVAAGLNL
ncbi:hypothetical protein GCM10020367_67290 [Streptomyces sannanensis]|uniref:Uncharacterized protein n=1 Tax=Streptomyces sannanensis TaxID=285536 RepID=A0ABP6S3P6_9ACTN